MRKQTAEFLSLCWDQLRTEDTEWQTERDFLDWASTECEVDARAYNTYLTKIDDEEPWGDENARIVNVMQDSDWNLVQSHSIAYREE